MQDVSEAHWAQEKLRGSEEKFRKLFENSFIGVALVDLSSGRWLDCNQALLNMLGYSREEMLQMTYADITPEAFRESDRRHNATLSTKRTYGPYQKAFIRKDRQEISIILAGFLVELEDGRRGGVESYSRHQPDRKDQPGPGAGRDPLSQLRGKCKRHLYHFGERG